MFADKAWGFFAIAAYGWSAFMLFLIAFCSSRKNGKHLLYSLYIGTGLACVLHIIDMQTATRYYGYSNGGSGRIAMLILVVVGCWFLMNKHDLILTKEESGPAGDVIKGIPGAVHDALFSGKAGTENGNQRSAALKKAPADICVYWRSDLSDDF